MACVSRPAVASAPQQAAEDSFRPLRLFLSAVYFLSLIHIYILGEGAAVTGMIDMGSTGVADVWQDVALCIRSMRTNFGTDAYTDPLLRAIGLAMDPRKFRYYLLLDDLF